VNDDELERLVSRLERPCPSPELDARIAEITKHVRPARSTGTIRSVVRLGGAIACAGVLGFVLGRQSVSVPTAKPPDPDRTSLAGVAESNPSPAVRTEVLANDAFVRLVTRPSNFVSVFGNQPLQQQSGHSEIQ
jgi:hypothetical protein